MNVFKIGRRILFDHHSYNISVEARMFYNNKSLYMLRKLTAYLVKLILVAHAMNISKQIPHGVIKPLLPLLNSKMGALIKSIPVPPFHKVVPSVQ